MLRLTTNFILDVSRWKSSTFQNRDVVMKDAAPNNFADYYLSFREHYISFPGIPNSKYSMVLLCFFFELIVISMVAYQRVTLSSPSTALEISFWVFGISSCMDTVDILIQGNRDYKINLADTAAILLGACFSVILLGRLCYQWRFLAEADLANLELIYDAVFMTLIIIAFLRMAMLMCVLSEKFGTLVLIIKKMTRDILNFGVLWFLFLCGFIFAEYYISREVSSNISDSGLGFFVLSAGGDPDYRKWEEVSKQFTYLLYSTYFSFYYSIAFFLEIPGRL